MAREAAPHSTASIWSTVGVRTDVYRRGLRGLGRGRGGGAHRVVRGGLGGVGGGGGAPPPVADLGRGSGRGHGSSQSRGRWAARWTAPPARVMESSAYGGPSEDDQAYPDPVRREV